MSEHCGMARCELSQQSNGGKPWQDRCASRTKPFSNPRIFVTFVKPNRANVPAVSSLFFKESVIDICNCDECLPCRMFPRSNLPNAQYLTEVFVALDREFTPYSMATSK